MASVQSLTDRTEVVSLVHYFGGNTRISVYCSSVEIAAFVNRIAEYLVIDPADIDVHRIERGNSLTIHIE